MKVDVVKGVLGAEANSARGKSGAHVRCPGLLCTSIDIQTGLASLLQPNRFPCRGIFREKKNCKVFCILKSMQETTDNKKDAGKEPNCAHAKA